MTRIIDDVYDKIAVVLDEILHDLGADITFNAAEVVSRYKSRFPSDHEFMEKRRLTHPSAHTLQGYLDGMLWEYSRLERSTGPRIRHVATLQYQFLRD